MSFEEIPVYNVVSLIFISGEEGRGDFFCLSSDPSHPLVPSKKIAAGVLGKKGGGGVVDCFNPKKNWFLLFSFPTKVIAFSFSKRLDLHLVFPPFPCLACREKRTNTKREPKLC